MPSWRRMFLPSALLNEVPTAVISNTINSIAGSVASLLRQVNHGTAALLCTTVCYSCIPCSSDCNSSSPIAPVARYSACEIAWHRLEHPVVEFAEYRQLPLYLVVPKGGTTINALLICAVYLYWIAETAANLYQWTLRAQGQQQLPNVFRMCKTHGDLMPWQISQVMCLPKEISLSQLDPPRFVVRDSVHLRHIEWCVCGNISSDVSTYGNISSDVSTYGQISSDVYHIWKYLEWMEGNISSDVPMAISRMMCPPMERSRVIVCQIWKDLDDQKWVSRVMHSSASSFRRPRIRSPETHRVMCLWKYLEWCVCLWKYFDWCVISMDKKKYLEWCAYGNISSDVSTYGKISSDCVSYVEISRWPKRRISSDVSTESFGVMFLWIHLDGKNIFPYISTRKIVPEPRFHGLCPP